MIYLCFSCYNEEKDLPQLLTRLHHFPDIHVVAYDDGSTDQTPALLSAEAQRLPLTLLSGTPNRGLGFGISVIMGHLTEHTQPEDVALFIDADNTHDIALAPLFVDAIQKGADVVIASRFLSDARMQGFPLYRQLLSHLASYYFRLILRIPGVRDYTSGFRAYRVGILKHLRAPQGKIRLSRGFECQVEILYRLSKYARVVEIPFAYAYDAKRGASKMRLLRTIRRSFFLGITMLLKRAPQ